MTIAVCEELRRNYSYSRRLRPELIASSGRINTVRGDARVCVCAFNLGEIEKKLKSESEIPIAP